MNLSGMSDFLVLEIRSSGLEGTEKSGEGRCSFGIECTRGDSIINPRLLKGKYMSVLSQCVLQNDGEKV